MIFIDIAGLTQQEELRGEYLQTLQLEGTEIDPDVSSRLLLLRQLRGGAGVTILTGPEGAPFWSLASIEVKVKIVPDGVDYIHRTSNELEWGLLAVGVEPTVAVNMAAGYADKPPTKVHRLYDKYQQAQELIAGLHAGAEPTSIINTAYHVEVVRDPGMQLQLVQRIEEQAAWDWEWDTTTSEPQGLAISTATRNYYLPIVGRDFNLGIDHGHKLRAVVAGSVLRIPTIWHNWKADCKTQWPTDPLDAFGAEADDTLVMAYLCGFNELGLKGLTRDLLDRDPLDYPGDLAGLDVDLAARYAAAGDTRNTYDLYHVLKAKLLGMGRQYQIYLDIERPLVPVIASMERYGSPVDPKRMLELRRNFVAMEEALRSFWWAREHLDIAKDADTREIVKRRTGYDPGSCRQDVLAKVEADWMDSILAYRRLRHRRRSFIDKHLQRWEMAGFPDSLVLYTDFNQAGGTDANDPRSFKRAPRSGRLSSSGEAGNFQNQPGDIRSIFVSPPRFVLGVLDYSSLELRTQAATSSDPGMLAALSAKCPDGPLDNCQHHPKCGDLHDDFQQRIIGLTGIDVGRTAAKNGNFNGAYMGTEDMLGTVLAKQRVHLPVEIRKTIVDSRRKAYPRYYEYCKEVAEQARVNGYADTLFGRRRYDPDLNASDSTVRGHAERSLINHVVGQGTAGDIVKMAMLRCVPVLKAYNAHLALQVHDELVFWLPEKQATLAMQALKAVMESIQLPGIKLLVSGGIGNTWEAAKS